MCVIKVANLKNRDITLHSSGEFSVNIRVLKCGRERQKGRVSLREMWLLKEITERYNTDGFEGRGRNYEPRNVSGLKKLEKERKWILPYSFNKESSNADNLILSL